MLKKIFFTVLFFYALLEPLQAQSVYLHEAQEDALEQEKEGVPFTGIVGLLLFLGIVYVVGTLLDSYKDNQRRKGEYRIQKAATDRIACKAMETRPDISKYQYKEAWQKGYKRAEYDKMFRTPRKLEGKTIEELIADYRHTCELGHIIQADKIMEEIGYFQNIENKSF